MNRLTALTLTAALCPSAARACDLVVLPYATTSTISFCLKTYDSSASNDNEKLTLKADATFAAGDIKLNLDHAGEANIGTLPTDRGQCYDMPVSGSETTGKEGYIAIKDQTSPAVWTAHCIEFRTAGHANAFYPYPSVNVAQWSGTNVLTPDTGGAPKVTVKDGTGPGEIDTNAGAVVSTTTAGTCSALGATAKSDVNGEVLDVLTVDTPGELAAIPATATLSFGDRIKAIYEATFYERETTGTSASGTETLRKFNGSSALCSSALSDDGSTFTRDRCQ